MPRSWSACGAASVDPLQLPTDRDLCRVQVHVLPPQPEHLAAAQSEHEDQDVPGVQRVAGFTGTLQEAACLVDRPWFRLARPGLGYPNEPECGSTGDSPSPLPPDLVTYRSFNTVIEELRDARQLGARSAPERLVHRHVVDESVLVCGHHAVEYLDGAALGVVRRTNQRHDRHAWVEAEESALVWARHPGL